MLHILLSSLSHTYIRIAGTHNYYVQKRPLLYCPYHGTDINECADECNNYCNYPNGSVCYNTIGSFECVCPTGYTECNGYRCICKLSIIRTLLSMIQMCPAHYAFGKMCMHLHYYDLSSAPVMICALKLITPNLYYLHTCRT